MKKSEANKRRIVEMLERHGSLGIGDLSDMLKLSEPSLRRYFAELETEKRLIRVHGGIRLPVDSVATAYIYTREAESHLLEKRRIANVACGFISAHDRVFLDSGTTVAECSRSLADRLANTPVEDLEIITISMACSATLANHCSVMVTGGHLRASRMDFCGSVTLDALRRYSFTRAFLGVDSISEDGTLGTTDDETAAMDAMILEQSSHCYILADSSKIGRRSFVTYASLAAKHRTLITDSGIPSKLLAKFRENNMEVIVV